MAIPYTELKARSAFSFGDGAMSPESLAERGANLGYSTLGLVDTCDFGGIIRFALSARTHGLTPVIGSELQVDGLPLGLLVRNEKGYRNLAHLITLSRLRSEPQWMAEWRLAATGAAPRGTASGRCRGTGARPGGGRGAPRRWPAP